MVGFIVKKSYVESNHIMSAICGYTGGNKMSNKVPKRPYYCKHPDCQHCGVRHICDMVPLKNYKKLPWSDE